MILIKCNECQKEFKTSQTRFNRNKNNCCSTKCLGKLNSRIHSKKIKTECSNCHKEIFYKQSRFKNITIPSCSKACSNTLKSIRYKGKNNPKSLNLNKLERFFWDKNKSVELRARAKKLNFDLDFQFLKDLFETQKGKCFYTDIPMILKSEKGLTNYNVLSIDRINSEKGYTRDNVVFCLNCINMFKAHHNLNDIKNVFKAIFLKEQNNIDVLVKKVYSDSILPYKKSIFDAGYDLYVHHFEDCGTYIKVYTGVAIQPEQSYYFFLAPRSSTYKKGLMLYNNLGIIDNNFSGEIIGIFYKTSDYKNIEIGDRLLQLIPQQHIQCSFKEVEELNPTDRMDKGFGSSGK